MKPGPDKFFGWQFCAVALFLAWPLHAQDTVTVPKSRLEELERKERELERLKGDVSKTKAENVELKTKLERMPTNQVTAPTAIPPAPALATLPPLQPDQVIDSVILAGYFRQEPAAAEQRFHNQRLAITGEVIGFEKPLLKRNYRVLLPGNDPATKVICDFYPPDKFNAVVIANHGAQLVGQIGETRVPLAKIGEHVLIRGLCKGIRESGVMISAGQMTQLPAAGK